MARQGSPDRTGSTTFPSAEHRGRWVCANGAVRDADGSGRRGGFSLIELLVVLSIAALLMALLMPNFIRLREAARQAACASNLHQVGLALSLYTDEYGGRLPSSIFSGRENGRGRKARPSEMIFANLGDGKKPGSIGWDGLGWLYGTGLIKSPQVFYCPSHTGSHPIERYRDGWANAGTQLVEINYHYRRDIDDVILASKSIDFFTMRYPDQAIVTDGMRTKQDFNHVVGSNMLRIDSVVRWFDDIDRQIYNNLPDESDATGEWRDPWPKFSPRN